MNRRPPYKAKSLSGAQARVRQLDKIVKERDDLVLSLLASKAIAEHERDQCAKLAAEGPAFFNPLEIYEAKKIRDSVLRSMHMNPDGTFIKLGA